MAIFLNCGSDCVNVHLDSHRSFWRTMRHRFHLHTTLRIQFVPSFYCTSQQTMHIVCAYTCCNNTYISSGCFFQLYAKQDHSLLFLHIHVSGTQLNKRTFTVHISSLAETARYSLVQSIYVPTSHSCQSECIEVASDLFTPCILHQTRRWRGTHYTIQLNLYLSSLNWHRDLVLRSIASSWNTEHTCFEKILIERAILKYGESSHFSLDNLCNFTGHTELRHVWVKYAKIWEKLRKIWRKLEKLIMKFWKVFKIEPYFMKKDGYENLQYNFRRLQ